VLNRYTTKDQVLKAFGVPSYKSKESSYEEWTYDFGSTNVTRSSANAYTNYYGGVSANGTTTNQTYSRYVKFTFNGDRVVRVTSNGVDYTEYTTADMTWLTPSMNYKRECLAAVNFANPNLNIFLEYYIKNGKYAIRSGYWNSNKVEGIDGYSDISKRYYRTTTTTNLKNFNFDFYRTIDFSKKHIIHSYFGPSITVMGGEVISAIDSMNPIKKSTSTQKKIYLYPNIRFGFESALNNRIGINFDLGYGYSTKESKLLLNSNFSFGYRFSIKKTDHKIFPYRH